MKRFLVAIIAFVFLLALILSSSVAFGQAPTLTEERIFAMVGRLHAQVELLTERVNALQQENAELRKQLEPTP